MKNIVLIIIFSGLAYFLYFTSKYETRDFFKNSCEFRYNEAIDAKYSNLDHEVFSMYDENSGILHLGNKKLHSLNNRYFKKSSCIRVLYLTDNAFARIPKTLQYLKNTKEIDISKNRLTYKGNEYFKFPEELQRLNLSSNLYAKFDIPRFKGLKNLNLSDNYIYTLNVPNSTKIEAIVLKRNKLKDFPRILYKVNGLKHLDLSENRFKYLNLISSVNSSKVNFKHLETLNLRNCKLVSLPKSFSLLPVLREIELEGNSIRGEVSLDDIYALESFEMKDQHATSFVIEKETAHHLKRINLENNELSHCEIKSPLPSLTDLNLKQNKLTTIPPSVSNLPKLIHINLAGNSISEIEEDLNINKTRRVDLQDNLLTTIPSFTRSKNLEHLYLNNNRIQTLDINHLNPYIVTLNLDGNDIREIKGNYQYLQISYLGLGNNPNLKEIPLSVLKRLRNLQSLSLINHSLNPNNFEGVKKYCLENDIKIQY